MRHMDRRGFLKAAAAATLGGSIAAGARAAEEPAATAAPAASAAAARPTIWVVHGSDPAAMLKLGIEKAGGWGAFVRPGARVTLKPNAAWACKPEEAANTDPDLVGACIAACKAAGAARVVVCENSCSPEAQSFAMSGIGPAVEKAGGRMYRPKKADEFRLVRIPGGQELQEAEVPVDVLDCDCLINMPIAKHHGAAGLTISMKNWMGSVKDRQVWHRKDLHRCIAEFSTFLKAHLIVVDATRILTTGGPRGPGKIERPGQIIVGRDPVACDAYAATLFGKQPFDIRYIRLAHELGVGCGDLQGVAVEHVEA